MAKTVKVISETDSGRNTLFLDKNTGKIMTRPQFVTEIEKGNYPEYYTKVCNGLKTPVSKPDDSENNNLG